MTACFVVDTNVLVSGLLTHEPDSPLAAIVDSMITGGMTFLLSPRLLTEYREVLLRPKVVRFHGLSEKEVDAVLTEIAQNGLWREPNQAASAPDPHDDHLWALLTAVPGAILVTGDQLLLHNPPSFASVISPRSCLSLIQTGK